MGGLKLAVIAMLIMLSAPLVIFGGSGKISGFRIYYGSSPSTYSDNVSVGNVTSHTLTSLSTGTYYFAATCLDFYANESGYSNEVSKYVGGGGTADLEWDRPYQYTDGTRLNLGIGLISSVTASNKISTVSTAGTISDVEAEK